MAVFRMRTPDIESVKVAELATEIYLRLVERAPAGSDYPAIARTAFEAARSFMDALIAEPPYAPKSKP